jgi:hypothetical protein
MCTFGQDWVVHALLRTGAGGRVCSFLSAAILRRSASMRLVVGRDVGQLRFGGAGMPACLALRWARRVSS